MSWKQYGGINKHDSMNNINLNSLSVDSLRLTGKYIGDFDVSGNLNASVLNITESLTIEKDITIKRDLTVNGNVNATGTLSFTDLGLTGNLTVAQNINAGKNIQTSGNITVAKNIFMGQNQQTFFHLENGNVGLNTYVPTASLDICGNSVSVLNVYSNKVESKNILARNVNGNGIVLSANSTASAINFYTDSPVNLSNIPTSYITATSSGNLLIDAKNTAQISSNVIIGNNSDLTQTRGESLAVFDNSTTNRLHYDIYNVGNANVGSGLNIYTNNNSSTTSLSMMTPSGKGASIISGTYPLDNTRSMVSINYSDSETGNIVPSQMIVSGNNAGKMRSTIGFNTYAPKTEKYAVDINGPIHVTNGYIKDAKSVNMEIRTVSRLSQFQQNMVALGSPSDITVGSYKQYCYYSTDGGQIWTRSNVNPGGEVNSDIEYSVGIFSSVYSYDASFSVAISSGTTVDKVTFIFYTADGGKNWYQFAYITPYNRPISSGSSVYIDADKVYIGYNNNIDYFINPYTNKDTLTEPFPKTVADTSQFYNIGIGETAITNVQISGATTINKMHGTSNLLIFACNNGVYIYQKNFGASFSISFLRKCGSENYLSVHSYGDNYIVAIGANIISYTHDNGVTWTNITISGTVFNDIYVYNEQYAIAVGNNKILYSKDGYQTWQNIPDEILTSAGNKSLLIDSAVINNFTAITMTDSNTFVISAVKTAYNDSVSSGNSHLFYCYFPNLFNRANNNVFDISGNMKLSGDINVDYGVNTNTLNVLAGVASTSVSNGSAIISGGIGISGNTNIGGITKLLSETESISSTSGSIIVSGGIGIGGNANIGGNVNITKDTVMRGNLRVSETVQANLISGNSAVFQSGGISIVGGNLSTNGFALITNTSESTLSSNGALRVSGGVGITGNTNIGGNLRVLSSVESASSSTGSLVVSGGVGVGLNLNVAGNIKTTSAVVSTSASTGAMVISGGVGIGGNTNIAGETVISGNISVAKSTAILGDIDSTGTSSGTLKVTGGVGITKNTNIGGNLRVLSSVESASSSTGSVVVSGGVGIGGNLIVAGNIKSSSGSLIISNNATINGNTNITSVNDSTTPSTGALIVDSGVGIGGNINVGGNTHIYSDTNSTVSTSGALIVDGGAGIAKDLFMGGNVFSDDRNGIVNFTNYESSDGGNIYIGKYPQRTRNIIIGNLDNTTNDSYINTIILGGTSDIIQIRGTLDTSVSSGTTASGNTIINGYLNVLTPINLTNQISSLDGVKESFAANSGVLVITGGVGISANVNVGGNITTSKNMYINGNTESTLHSNGTFVVPNGGAGIHGNLNVGGNSTIEKIVIVKGNVESTTSTSGTAVIYGGLGVNANTNIGGNLYVGSGIESFSTSTGALHVDGGIGASGNIQIGGNGVVAKNFTINGTTESTNRTNGALLVKNGGAGIYGSLNVGGNVNISGGGGTGAESTAYNSGTLTVVGGIGSSGNITTSGNITVLSSIQSTDALSGAIIVKNGGMGVIGNIYSGNNVVAGGNVTAANIIVTSDLTSTSSTNGALLVTGGVGVTKTLNVAGITTVEATGKLLVGNTTQSTSTTTGGAIFSGGIAVAKNQYLGGNLIAGNVIYVNDGRDSIGSSWTSLAGAIQVTGGVSLSKSLWVGNSLTVASNNQYSSITTTTSDSLRIYRPDVNANDYLYFGNGTNTSVGYYNATNSAPTWYINRDGSGNFAGQITAKTANIKSGQSLTDYANAYSFGTTAGNLIYHDGSSTGGNIILRTNNSTNYVFNSTAINVPTKLASNTITSYGATQITCDKPFIISDTTASTSANSGSLQVDGGIGVNGNIYCDGNINLTDTNVRFRGDVFHYIGYASTANGINGIKLAGYEGGNLISSNVNETTSLSWRKGNVTIPLTTASTNATSGALIVSGGIGIAGNIYCGGKSYITSTTESTSSTTGAFIVSGGVGIAGNGNIAGNLIVGGNIYSNKQLWVTSGSTNADKTRGIFYGANSYVYSYPGSVNNLNINVDGNLYTYTSTGLTIGTGISSTNSTSGALIVTGGVGVSGNAYIGGGANISGIANISSSQVSTSYQTGAVVVSGGVGISGNLNVGSNISVSGITTISNTLASTSSVTGAIIVSGGVGIAGNLNIGGNVNVGGNVRISNTLASTSTTTGAFVVTGGVGIGGNLNIDGNVNANGNVRIGNTLQSTSSTTGAFVVTGGVGIGGNGNIGGNLTVGDIIYATDGTDSLTSTWTSLKGTIQVSGGVSLSKSLWVGNSLTVASNNQYSSITTTTADSLRIYRPDVNSNDYLYFGNGTTTSVGYYNATNSAPTWYINRDGSGNFSGQITAKTANIKSGQSLTDYANAYSFGTTSGNLIYHDGSSTGGNIILRTNNSTNYVFNSTAINVPTKLASNTITSYGATQITCDKPFIISDTTASTSVNSGSLQVDGGVGLNGNIYCGGTIFGNYGLSISTFYSGNDPSYNTVQTVNLKKYSSGTLFFDSTGSTTPTTTYIVPPPTSYSGYSWTIVNRKNIAVTLQIETTGDIITLNGGGVSSLSVPPGAVITIISNYNHWIVTNYATSGIDFNNSWTGINTISNTTASTSTTTGAFKVTGGVGIGGNIYCGGATNSTSFNATSDYRIKANVVPLNETFSVTELNPVHYYNTILQKPDIGFLAHEVQEVYPYLVNGEKDGKETQSINYNGLIGILVKEIKDLKQEVTKLRGRIEDLETNNK